MKVMFWKTKTNGNWVTSPFLSCYDKVYPVTGLVPQLYAMCVLCTDTQDAFVSQQILCQ